jgi:hypothetical protein
MDNLYTAEPDQKDHGGKPMGFMWAFEGMEVPPHLRKLEAPVPVIEVDSGSSSSSGTSSKSGRSKLKKLFSKKRDKR